MVVIYNMSGFQIRSLDFVTVEEDTVCDNCADVCERKAEMVKQECKCGCGAFIICCMDCPTGIVAGCIPVCKRTVVVENEKQKN